MIKLKIGQSVLAKKSDVEEKGSYKISHHFILNKSEEAKSHEYIDDMENWDLLVDDLVSSKEIEAHLNKSLWPEVKYLHGVDGFDVEVTDVSLEIPLNTLKTKEQLLKAASTVHVYVDLTIQVCLPVETKVDVQSLLEKAIKNL